jgi:hypothetical protein
LIATGPPSYSADGADAFAGAAALRGFFALSPAFVLAVAVVDSAPFFLPENE